MGYVVRGARDPSLGVFLDHRC